ncbi:sigma-70 family RNA polymerase sigma factor [Nakamurella silvestris]|nr:sigma-70 family RNA polymerase sigma factor [Nakamurella silvestris]
MEEIAVASLRPGADSAEILRSIYSAEFSRLSRLAYLLGAEDPEDVVQDAFLRLYRHPAHLHSGHAVGYLQRIVVNLTRDGHRRAELAARHLSAPPEGVIVSPEHGVTQVAAIEKALRLLSPRHRQAIVLRYWLDLDLRGIADAMGVSLGTAKGHLSRATEALRNTAGSDFDGSF